MEQRLKLLASLSALAYLGGLAALLARYTRGLRSRMSSATQALDSPSSEQRPVRGGRVGSGVEELQERIAALVQQRQQLRTCGASRASLERNRLQLVGSQWELRHALIERHLPQAREAARPMDGRGDSQAPRQKPFGVSPLIVSHSPPQTPDSRLPDSRERLNPL